jgi:hypothetical protein
MWGGWVGGGNGAGGVVDLGEGHGSRCKELGRGSKVEEKGWRLAAALGLGGHRRRGGGRRYQVVTGECEGARTQCFPLCQLISCACLHIMSKNTHLPT